MSHNQIHRASTFASKSVAVVVLWLSAHQASAGVLSLRAYDEPVQDTAQPTQSAETDESKESQLDDESTSDQVVEPKPKHLTSFLAEPLGEVQNKLSEHGIDLHLYFNYQYQASVKGGPCTNGGKGAGSTDIFLLFDLEDLKLLDDSELFIHFQANWGAGINPYTGTLSQVNDDADGSLGGHIAQMWYRLFLAETLMSLRIGYLDFQAIVDRNAFANSEDIQFWNQSLDNNPIVPLNIGLGAALTLRPTNWYTLIIGAGDAQNKPYAAGFRTTFQGNAWFRSYLENGFHVKLPSDHGPLAGNYRIGIYYDPLPKNNFERSTSPSEKKGNWGVYISLDQMLYRESDADDQGLGFFGRFGRRDRDVNRMSQFWSAGLQYKGMVPGRDADVMGFGYSFLRSSREYRRYVDSNLTDESVYELYYAIRFSPHFVVTPDIQYIVNPGAENAYRDLIVAGVRLRLAL